MKHSVHSRSLEVLVQSSPALCDRANPQRFVAAPLMRKMFVGQEQEEAASNMTTLTTNRCSRALPAMGALGTLGARVRFPVACACNKPNALQAGKISWRLRQ